VAPCPPGPAHSHKRSAAQETTARLTDGTIERRQLLRGAVGSVASGSAGLSRHLARVGHIRQCLILRVRSLTRCCGRASGRPSPSQPAHSDEPRLNLENAYALDQTGDAMLGTVDGGLERQEERDEQGQG
jgi:hypothetical protein